MATTTKKPVKKTGRDKPLKTVKRATEQTAPPPKPDPQLDAKLKKLLAIDDKISGLNAQLKALNAEYETAERVMIEALQASKLESIKGPNGSAFIATREVAGIEDYDAFMSYVIKHKATDLVQRRVAVRAYLDRIENGEKVPGIKLTKLINVNIRRSK